MSNKFCIFFKLGVIQGLKVISSGGGASYYVKFLDLMIMKFFRIPYVRRSLKALQLFFILIKIKIKVDLSELIFNVFFGKFRILKKAYGKLLRNTGALLCNRNLWQERVKLLLSKNHPVRDNTWKLIFGRFRWHSSPSFNFCQDY